MALTCKLANAAVLVSCGHPDRALQSRCHRGCAPSECARGGSGPCFMQRLVSLSISCPVSISFQSASGVTLPSTNSYCLIHVRTHDYTQGPSCQSMISLSRSLTYSYCLPQKAMFILLQYEVIFTGSGNEDRDFGDSSFNLLLFCFILQTADFPA